MNRDYKPAAYPSVSAYVVANNAQRVIDFLRQTFDAKEVRRFDKPDGSIVGFQVSCAVVHESCPHCPTNPAPILHSVLLPGLVGFSHACVPPSTCPTYPPHLCGSAQGF